MRGEVRFAFLVLLFVAFLFFHPILRGWVAFPADFLVGYYPPYNSYPFLGYAPGGYPHKGQNFDVLRLLYPAKEFSIVQLQQGILPLWNPYNFSGNPHLASLQSGTFYPFNVVFFLFSFPFAWSIYIILQPILTGLFTFLFIRRLGIGQKGAIFGSIVFAFSSYMVVWMQYGNIGHSILWLPLVLWLFLQNSNKPTVFRSCLIVLALTFSIFAGYIQTSFYVFAFLSFFMLFYIVSFKQHRPRNIGIALALLLLPLLLAAIQLLPTNEILFHSARLPYTKEAFFKLLIPKVHLVTLVAPDFFGNPATRTYWLEGTYIERVFSVGVVPLLFALFGVFVKRNPTVLFFAAAAIITLVVSFDSFLSRALYGVSIPLITTAVPTRIMFLFCFSMSILAAFGLDAFLNDTSKRKKFLTIASIIGIIYAALWGFVLIAPIPHFAVSKRNLILPSLLLIGVIVVVRLTYSHVVKRHIFAIFILMTVVDLFYFFQKITPFAPASLVYPQTEVLTVLKRLQGIDRSWGFGGNSYLETNVHTHERIFSPEGYDALHIKRYGELITTAGTGNIQDPPPGSDAVLPHEYGLNFLRVNINRQRLLNLLGVKYILYSVADIQDNVADYQNFPSETYRMVWNKPQIGKKGGWQIYENRRVLPRAFLVGDYVVEKNKKNIANMILNEQFNLQEKVIVEEDFSKEFSFDRDEKAQVKVVFYTPNKVVIGAKAAKDMILFLSDNYFPGWGVKVDGKGAKMYRANYAFRAVPLKEGEHEVVFLYSPDSFRWGLWVSIVGTLGIVTVSCLSLIRKKHG